MEDSHILNAIKYFYRNRGYYKEEGSENDRLFYSIFDDDYKEPVLRWIDKLGTRQPLWEVIKEARSRGIYEELPRNIRVNIEEQEE